MNAQQKAEYLVNKYLNLPLCESVEAAKYAANICIDEILLSNPTIQGDSEDLVTKIIQTKAYWHKVKEEVYSL